MTSMPASRRARAITLAPRSCPSRPGLATNTRIFLSAMPCIVALANELPQWSITLNERLQLCVGEEIPALGFECLNYMRVTSVVKKRHTFTSNREIIEICQLKFKRLLGFLCNTDVFRVTL